MQMVAVETGDSRRAFLEMPRRIYQSDPNWIRPLDKDVEEVFDPKKNKLFQTGACARWLLRDASGDVIGRVAAFVNRKYRNEQPTGGIGFFECVDSYEAAAFMFDHCREWLRERGMEAMDGPINFGERDRWWGLQVAGFQPPLYCMNYNPPYYQGLFERYGFQVYFEQVCFSRRVVGELPEKFYRRHAELAKDSEYEARPISRRALGKYVSDFTEIYNKAWAGHGGGKTMDERTVGRMFEKMKPIIDESITWFAYHRGKPIAMWVNLPDLNQYMQHFDGRFGLLEQLRFLWMLRFGRCSRFVGLAFGVVPEYQGMGVDGYLIVAGGRVIQELGRYESYEMQWIGDFNPKMINIAEGLGTERSRKLATYRYLFDRSKPFVRHRML